MWVTSSAPNHAPTIEGLRSLAPRFEEARHGHYVRGLIDALEDPSVRNLALAGAYGSGKSSVLQEVTRQLGPRVVSVSLSTLAKGEDAPPPADGNPAAVTVTNRIQKEIVKQLLYQAADGTTPESRFRRMTPFRWNGTAIIPAMIAGSALGAAFMAYRWSESLQPAPSLAVQTVLVTLVTAALVLLLRRLTHRGALSVSGITAGPATVTLSREATSYFDEYLDEIVYRFLANKWDVVVFEDIDRFENVEIFESLRSLNTLLNGAVRGRLGRGEGLPVRFVYALRDSVFEQLGQPKENESTDAALLGVVTDEPAPNGGDASVAELSRANRTKFFDIVIPMVPFITYRNARELMKRELGGAEVSEALIDLVAKHVAEMRLIRNSRNELEVFSEQLLRCDLPLPGLTADRLYALILYKSFHMADFERIRTAQSLLDTLFHASRQLINHSIARRQERRQAILEGTRAAERASSLGRRLAEIIRVLRTPLVIPVDIDSPEFWRDAAQITVREQGNHHKTLDRSQLSTILGANLDPGFFIDIDERTRERELTQIEADLAMLRRATWRDLLARDDFKDHGDRTFAQMTESILESRLAIELVRHGFITEYFALDIAPVYGQMVDPTTYNYMIHFVDRGEADIHYQLTHHGVEAIIRDYGPDVLRERSMQNLTVMDYLLARLPTSAEMMVEDLLKTAESAQDFFANYLASGTEKTALVRLLAPRWPVVFTQLMRDTATGKDQDETSAIIENALSHSSDEIDYDLTPELRDWIEQHYTRLRCFTDAESVISDIDRAMAIAQLAEVAFPDVAPLSPIARERCMQARTYQISAHNFVVLTGTDDITLDHLADLPDAFAHAINHLAEYITKTSTTAGAETLVTKLEVLIQALAASHPSSTVLSLLDRTDPELVIEDLTQFPEQTWPTLVAAHRVTATFSNVSRYREKHGIDVHLAALLVTAAVIHIDSGQGDAERRDLAEAILNAREQLPAPDLRVTLAASLAPGPLEPGIVANESGMLAANLLSAKLLPDTAETFNQPIMDDWATFKAALLASEQFRSFMAPNLVRAGHVAELLADAGVPQEVKQTIVGGLNDYAAAATGFEVAAIAQEIQRQGWSMAAGQLHYLLERDADADTIVGIMAASDLSLDELLAVLARMPHPYAELAGPLSGPLRLPSNVATENLVDRLKQHGMIRVRRIGSEIGVYPFGG